MGGDEFHILLENTNEDQVVESILKIKRIISEKIMPVDKNNFIKVSAASGSATRDCPNQNIDSIIALADKRMYEDKNRMKSKL